MLSAQIHKSKFDMILLLFAIPKIVLDDWTIDHNEILTLVSMGTFLLSASTCLTIKLVITNLIENAVIISLLKGEPLAVHNLIAFFNTFLKSCNGK